MKISRRALLAAGVLPRAAAAYQFRLAICNETFQGLSLADACDAALRTGYTGIEIAPFTLAEDPAAIPAARRREMRDLIAGKGLEYAGLHSLLSAPKGLHVTTPDKAVRDRSWDYVSRLIELCADLGRGGVLVFGSGKQRSAVDGSGVGDATRRFEEGLARMAPLAAE